MANGLVGMIDQASGQWKYIEPGDIALNIASGETDIVVPWATTLSLSSISNDGSYHVLVNNGLLVNTANSWIGIPVLGAGTSLLINGSPAASNPATRTNTVWNSGNFWINKVGSVFTIVTDNPRGNNVHWSNAKTVAGFFTGIEASDRAQGQTLSSRMYNFGAIGRFVLGTASTLQIALNTFNTNNIINNPTLAPLTQVRFANSTGNYAIANLADPMPVGEYFIFTNTVDLWIQQMGVATAGGNIAPPWQANTFIPDTSIRAIPMAGVMCFCQRNGDITTGSSLTEAEAAGWRRMGQEMIPGFAANTVYVSGFEIRHNGRRYQRIAAGNSGATFDGGQWQDIERFRDSNWGDINAGVGFTCGSIQLRMTTGAAGQVNRSIQAASNNADTLAFRAQSIWEGGGGPLSSFNANNANWQYIDPNINLTNIGQCQKGIVHDMTNNRTYDFTYTVAAGHNNSPMFIKEF
jgi:hypothetical protein